MARYRRNYITEAIIRINFEEPIQDLRTEISQKLEDAILNRGFENKEVKKAFSEEIKLDGITNGIKRSRTEFNEWNYYGSEKTKRFCITKQFMFIAYQKYINHSDFVNPFLEILDEFVSNYGDVISNRIGMRYINNVDIDGKDPMEWHEYIKDKLLCIFSVPIDKKQISRAFQILELNYDDDDVKLKFQYGMHNPDYPALIKQKIFVLDYDAYKTGSLSTEEVNHLIPSLHTKISELFEKSIGDKLRGVMNEE